MASIVSAPIPHARRPSLRRSTLGLNPGRFNGGSRILGGTRTQWQKRAKVNCLGVKHCFAGCDAQSPADEGERIVVSDRLVHRRHTTERRRRRTGKLSSRTALRLCAGAHRACAWVFTVKLAARGWTWRNRAWQSAAALILNAWLTRRVRHRTSARVYGAHPVLNADPHQRA